MQVCTDSPTNCQNLVSNPGTSGTTTFQGDADHTYWFRVWAKDRVDNETTAESGPYGTASLTKYYLFGGQRVAMRQGSAVYFLHGDHLGSTSLTTAVTGQLVSQARYTPFGGLHWESGEAQTDFGFTGQRAERGMGLMDYNARFYAAALGRFVSADPLVPGAGNPLAWDRYSYVMGNPLNNVDPSGHRTCTTQQAATGDETCEQNATSEPEDVHTIAWKKSVSRTEMIEYITSFGINLTGTWTATMLTNLWEALFKVIGYQNLLLLLRGKSVTLQSGETATCEDGVTACYSGLTEGRHVTFYQNGTTNSVMNILHEMGHLVDNLWNDYFTKALEKTEFTLAGEYLAGWNGEAYQFLDADTSSTRDVRKLALRSANAGGGDAWQQRGGTAHWEDWGDIFANGMIGNINLSTDLGGQIGNFYTNMINIPLHSSYVIDNGGWMP